MQLQCSVLPLQHLHSDAQSLSLPVSSFIFQFLCPDEWRDLSLRSANTPMLPEDSLLNCILQGTAASLHQIRSEIPSVE